MDREIKLKAALYGIPLFLGPFADKIGSILFLDKWPSIPMVAGCTLLGIMSACIGLRAYFDGSYERGQRPTPVAASSPVVSPPSH